MEGPTQPENTVSEETLLPQEEGLSMLAEQGEEIVSPEELATVEAMEEDQGFLSAQLTAENPTARSLSRASLLASAFAAIEEGEKETENRKDETTPPTKFSLWKKTLALAIFGIAMGMGTPGTAEAGGFKLSQVENFAVRMAFMENVRNRIVGVKTDPAVEHVRQLARQRDEIIVKLSEQKEKAIELNYAQQRTQGGESDAPQSSQGDHTQLERQLKSLDEQIALEEGQLHQQESAGARFIRESSAGRHRF